MSSGTGGGTPAEGSREVVPPGASPGAVPAGVVALPEVSPGPSGAADVAAPEARRLAVAAAVAALLLLPAVLGTPAALIVAVPAALAAFVLCLRRPWRTTLGIPAAPLTAACAATLAADFAFRGPQGYALLWAMAEYPLLLLLLRRTARRAPERVVLALAPLLALAAALLPLRFLFSEPAASGPAVAFACVVAVFPAGAAAAVGVYFRTVESRGARALTVALDRQRLHVAADLHDFVAHELTGIVVEAQSAQWTGDLGAEETKELLARVEAAGVRALESMDRTVQSLRADAPPTQAYGLADLPRLVEQYAAPGPDARVELRPAPGLEGTLPRLTDDAAYRVVVEALTNIRRHATGVTRVTVDVVRAVGPGGAPAIEVTVANDGAPTTAPRPGGGTGLPGLGLRVQALGGELSWGPYGNGWRVRALLPA
ncbi:sensor histidine kinase [Streptomyces boninensis]|uniref:sensor histidine kinase n=1 Tax=Streptomyces boninensis TaxID=2039455 RepID=UPI003B21A027